MPGFEEEAFRRAQQISRPRVVKERAETVREPEKPKPKPEVKEEQKAELPNINNSKARKSRADRNAVQGQGKERNTRAYPLAQRRKQRSVAAACADVPAYLI